MAVRTDVLLLADSGDVTVARRTAFYTYGKFEVILPDEQVQEETDTRLADGYIAQAYEGQVGRFDFGFIRADAMVNIDAGTSDLETQIDSAGLRAEGDVFFESDIGPEGFNGFIPGVDFDTGDIISVQRWGSRISLPVTNIEYEVSTAGGPRASRVHVSGQLISDGASRRRSNDEIRQQIAAEKRERLRQVGIVDRKAQGAQDSADEADQKAQGAQEAADAADRKAGTADGKAENALTGVDGLHAALAGAGATAEDLQDQLEALNQQLQEQGEGTEEKLPLIQAYISANTARWELQAEVDEMQNRVSAELQAQQIAIKQEFEADRASRSEIVIASAAGSSNPAHTVTNLPDGRWRVRLDGMAGTSVISDTWELDGLRRVNLVSRQYSQTEDTLYVTRNANEILSLEWVRTPGFVRSVNNTWEGKELHGATNEWHLLDMVPEISVGASGTSNFDMSISIRFPDGWGYYRIQIRAGNTILADKTARGSSTIFQTRSLTMNLSVSDTILAPHTDVRVYFMRWDARGLGNSAISKVITRASWTERNV